MEYHKDGWVLPYGRADASLLLSYTHRQISTCQKVEHMLSFFG